MSADPEEDFEAPDLMAALKASIDAAQERIATCHERVDCPKCWAPTGVRCRALPAGYVIGVRGGGSGRTLKHSHAERLRADGIALH
jgi:hypothetical protein